MGYTFATFTSTLQEMAAVAQNDTDFATILNPAIDYAEQRIYRDIDFLVAQRRDTSLALTPYSRSLVFNTNTPFVMLSDVAVMSPISPADQIGLKRNPLTPVSRNYLDLVYGSPIPVGMPRTFAMFDDHTILFGPFPDKAYKVELIGPARPAPLYSTPNGTWVSLNLPDLMLAATMVFLSAYQKNFGSAADNSQQAISWEQAYESAMKTADTDEQRRRFQASGWTSLAAPDAATPER